MVNKTTKRDIFFKKLTEFKNNNLKLVVAVEGLNKNEFKQVEEQFKKCDYLVMLCEDGGTQTIRFG